MSEEAQKVKLGFSLQSLLNWIEKTEARIEALKARVSALEANLKEAKETEQPEEDEEW